MTDTEFKLLVDCVSSLAEKLRQQDEALKPYRDALDASLARLRDRPTRALEQTASDDQQSSRPCVHSDS